MSDPMSELPLQGKAQDGMLCMAIGFKTLRWVAENHPYFWDGESDIGTPNIRVTDEGAFAREVLRAINTEDEDGSTLMTRMIDAAIRQAVEDGCEGVDHED